MEENLSKKSDDERRIKDLIKNLDPNICSEPSKINIMDKIRSVFDIEDSYDIKNNITPNYKNTVINYNTHVYFKPISTFEDDNTFDFVDTANQKNISLNEKAKKGYFLNKNFIQSLLKTKEQGEILEQQKNEILKLKTDLISKENESKIYKKKIISKSNKHIIGLGKIYIKYRKK